MYFYFCIDVWDYVTVFVIISDTDNVFYLDYVSSPAMNCSYNDVSMMQLIWCLYKLYSLSCLIIAFYSQTQVLGVKIASL